MHLPARTATFDFPALIAHTVAPYRTGAIEIYDPAAFSVDKPYDALTDTGGVKTYTVLWQGPARIQPLRENGDIYAYHFDIELDDDTPFFRKGLRIRVTDGGKNHALEEMGYSITSATNSASAAQRTILAVSEGAEVPRGR